VTSIRILGATFQKLQSRVRLKKKLAATRASVSARSWTNRAHLSKNKIRKHKALL